MKSSRVRIKYFNIYLLILASCFLFLASPIYAGSGDVGRSSGLFLKIDPSAESAGYGSAFTARTDDVHSLYFNPSGLGFINNNQFLLTYNDIFANISYSYASYAMPINDGKGGGFGVSVTLLDYGSMNRTQVAGNAPITGLGTFSADDLAVSLSYGRIIYNDNLSIGITGKYVKETIYNYDDNTVTVDLGLKWKTDIEGLSVGLVFKNIAGGLKFVKEEDSLPKSIAGGINYKMLFSNKRNSLNLGVDIVDPNDNGSYFAAGLDFTYNNLLSLRCGFNGMQDADAGLTVGAGFNFENLSVDYAFIPYDDLGDMHRVSLKLMFGDK